MTTIDPPTDCLAPADVRAVVEAHRAACQAIHARNEAIRRAVADGAGVRAIARASGLSAAQVSRIARGLSR